MVHSELSLWTKKLLILIGLWILFYGLYILQWLVIMLMISGFITILINPLVNRGELSKIPAWLTVIAVYIVLLLLGSIVVGTVIPIVINYVTDTATAIINWANTAQSIYIREGLSGFHFHPYIEKGIEFTLGKDNIDHTLDIIKQNAGNIQSFLTNQISSITTGGISFVSTVGWVVAEWMLIGVTTFFMVLERKQVWKFILEAVPQSIGTYLRNHYHQIQDVCNAWIKASLILSVSIFVTTYIWLVIVQFAFDFDTERTFTLAIISGIMEFIPYIGPIIALIPALIIGLWISWEAAIALTILYLIIQQLENNVLVPYVMSKNLDLSPFLVFVVMLVGASLWGILGIILAIPVAGICRVIYLEYQKKRNSPQWWEKMESPNKNRQKKLTKES